MVRLPGVCTPGYSDSVGIRGAFGTLSIHGCRFGNRVLVCWDWVVVMEVTRGLHPGLFGFRWNPWSRGSHPALYSDSSGIRGTFGPGLPTTTPSDYPFLRFALDAFCPAPLGQRSLAGPDT